MKLQEENWIIHKPVDIKQHTPEQPMGQGRNQKENKKVYLDKQKWKYNIQNLMGYNKSSSKRKIYSNKCLHSEKRMVSNKQPNFIPQGTKKEHTKSKDSRRK